MKDGLTKNERKEWARMLYTQLNNSIRDTALQVSADEAVVHGWIEEGAWDGVKRSLLVSKRKQLEHLYDVIDMLYAKVRNADEISTKDADLILKYTAAIKNLDVDTPVSDIIDVAEQFVTWLRHKDLELTKKVILQLDAFIKQKLSPAVP